MAGKLACPASAEHDSTYVKNLTAAASILEQNDIVGVIEPINKYALPGYYLACYKKALQVLQQVNSPNLRLMFDIYHAQHIRGDITKGFQEYGPFIGHVQLAQVPSRHEPDSDGELNYRYVLQTLEASGYGGDWVGCEYKPKGKTEEGLGWLRAFGYWK